jgi:UDP-glucose:(heptosyl)LPS alpha-1,3-glucosyltransferase
VANVGIVIHDFDPGLGQGRYAVELAKRLAPAHRLHVFANTFKAGVDGVVFHRVPAVRRNTLATVVTFLEAAEAMLRMTPLDLVHAQGLTSWTADVSTAHVCNAARMAAEPSKRWQDQVFRSVVTPLERRFYQHARLRHVIAVSRGTARDVETHYGYRGPSSVVYHGTDTAQFHPATAEEKRALRARYGLREDAWVWLFAGEVRKGLDAAIDALRAHKNATLLVVTRSDLSGHREQARGLGVADRVVFHGPEAQIALAYRAADAFLYPSTYDTFALVVSEAMASGLPVVVGRDIGAAEWIVDGENGLLCDGAQPASVARALSTLAALPDRGAPLGAAARATVESHTWDRCAAETLAVYESLLAQPRARQAFDVVRVVGRLRRLLVA